MRPAIVIANVLLPDPDGPTINRHPPARSSNDTSWNAAVERSAVGEPESGRLDPARTARRSAQSGNPSSTPVRRRDLTRMIDPPAAITAAETIIATARSTWTVVSTAA